MFFTGGRERFDCSHPPQPRFNLGCGWRQAGMRSLTNALIVVAGVVFGGRLAGRANGLVARVGDPASLRIAIARRDFRSSKASLRYRACSPFDRPTKTRFASRTDFGGQSGGSSGKADLELKGSLLCPRARGRSRLGLRFGATRFAGLRRGGGPASNLRAARNSVAPDGTATSSSRFGSVLRSGGRISQIQN
jgi:hypothetical protein